MSKPRSVGIAPDFADALAARERPSEVLAPTPLRPAPRLSQPAIALPPSAGDVERERLSGLALATHDRDGITVPARATDHRRLLVAELARKQD